MNGIYVLLGSNLGDRLAQLREASRQLQQEGIKVLNESSIYETAPWGKENQDWFLNVVLQLETSLSSNDLLGRCLSIEEKMGRKRTEKWSQRIIDIDILYYKDEVSDSEDLILPHPGIPDRRFTLIPLDELAPEEIHPVLRQTQKELLANCTDQLACKLTEFYL